MNGRSRLVPENALKFGLFRQDLGWPGTLAALSLGLLVITGLFWSDIVSVVSIWTNSSAHRFSFLVLPIGLYLVWIRRRDVTFISPEPFLAGIWLAAPLCLFWMLAEVAHISVGRHLAVMGFIQVVLLTTLGIRVYKALLFPFFYLWLMVPVGDFLVPALMDITTTLTVGGVDLLGIDVRSEGYMIYVPHDQYEIIEACASFDFLIGSLAISLLYGNLLYRSWRKRFICVAVALLAAVVANNVRTISIIAIMEWTKGTSDLVDYHVTYGWFLFLFAMLFLLGVGWIFRDPAEAEPSAPIRGREPKTRFTYAKALLSVVLVALLAGASKTYAAAVTHNDGPPPRFDICIPAQRGSWNVDGNSSDWRPRLTGSDGELLKTFLHADQRVDLYVAYFWRQRQGAEVVRWGKHFADREIWFPLDRASDEIQIDGEPLQIQTSRLRAQARRRLVWEIYWVDNTFTGSPMVAKLLTVKAALLGGEQRAGYLAISSEENAHRNGTKQTLQSFLDDGPSLRAMLEEVNPETGSCPGDATL